MKEMIKRAETLTKLLMTGYRNGSEKRREWMHPQDVVELVEQIPGVSEGMREYAQTIAWLHDIIEDPRSGFSKSYARRWRLAM